MLPKMPADCLPGAEGSRGGEGGVVARFRILASFFIGMEDIICLANVVLHFVFKGSSSI